MSGDYSRIAFDPWLDDLGVLLEQGRPIPDRDWSDLVLQLTRRIQAGTLDTFANAVVPTVTPKGFEIEAVGGDLFIGQGRIYVDGLLAENHGSAPDGGTLSWDPKLAELFGSAPLDYVAQPYYPNAPALSEGGPHLVYVDIWQREVNRYIRSSLVDPAIGLETSTRLQTVWQVKLLEGVGTGVTCTTPLDQFPDWLPDHAPSAGRLSVTTAPVPGQPDPCQVPPTVGFKGLDHFLYRVEVHHGGPIDTATFKWARHNASIEAAVLEIPSLTQLIVDSIGRDDVLRFADGDWIEIIDDWLELHQQPGVMRRIKMGDGVNPTTRTITLDSPLPSSQFPTDLENQPAAARHTRIRRWDQKKKVLNAAGNEIQDLDDVNSNGTILIPAGGTQVLLEYNIVVSFSLQPTGGTFRTGDYWVFAARSTDASVEELVDAPPRGIHHHYAKLALVTFPGDETDCRLFWPPSQQPPTQPPTTVEQCACTVCVTPQSHSSGTLTLQMAIDQVLQHGGGTICLDVGTYSIQQTLQVQQAGSLRITGKGFASRLLSQMRVLHIVDSQDVTLEALAIECRPTSQAPDAALMLSSSSNVRCHELSIGILNDNPAWSAVGLSGALVGISVSDSQLSGAVGIRSVDATGGETGLTDLRIENNTFDCELLGVQLADVTIHQFVSLIRGNRLLGCSQSGMSLTGATVPGFGVEIADNVFSVLGHGVVATLDGLRVVDNDILQEAEAPGEQDGIRLMPGLGEANSLDDVQIIGNRITGFKGAGIQMRAPLSRALMIKQNRLERIGGHGIVFDAPQRLEQVSIENNQLSEVQGSGIRAEGEIGTLVASGNQIETRSGDPAAFLIFGRGEILFVDNQIVREGTANVADVLLGNRTLIVTSNRVQVSGLSMDLTVPEGHFTVLGNICRGRILVNGGALPAPWTPLSMQNVT